MGSFHELLPVFECKQIIFLNSFLFSRIPVFEAAILAYKQKMRISEMPQIQYLVYKIKASFIPNSKPLPRSTQFLHEKTY